MSEFKLWYMRDNHTFRSLPLDVEGALRALADEFHDGYTYGMLCSKHPALEHKLVHASGSEKWPEFAGKARQWLTEAIPVMQT